MRSVQRCSMGHFTGAIRQKKDRLLRLPHRPRSAQSPPVTLRGFRLLPMRATDPTDRRPPPSVVASDCKPTTHVKVVLLLLPSPYLANRIHPVHFLPRSLSPSLSLPSCSLQPHPTASSDRFSSSATRGKPADETL